MAGGQIQKMADGLDRLKVSAKDAAGKKAAGGNDGTRHGFKCFFTHERK